jgi:hypothetical protein
MRAVARVFEGAPHTGLAWLIEGADHATACSRSFWHDGRVTQGQLDALLALRSAVTAGAGSETEALRRLARSPPGVWTALAPGRQLWLTVDVGARPRALAPRGVPQVVPVLAPAGVPRCLTDGCKAYPTALLGHGGQGVQLPRRQAPGPASQPRWMPLSGLLSAPGVQTVRRQRLGRGQPRGVCGTLEAVPPVLAGCGWQINTACIERVNRSLRQHVAAVGRRVPTRGQGEDGLRQQLVLYQVSSHFCWPHASGRQPLPQPAPTNGTGSAQRWRPCTPARAAGLTDRVWTLSEVWLYRGPPGPQPAGV